MSSEESHEQRHEQIERQIAFIVDQQSKFLTDIDRLREAQIALVEVQNQTSADVRDLARIVVDLAGTMSRFEVQAEADRQEVREGFTRLEIQAQADRQEMREGFARVDAHIEAERQEMREGFARMDARMDRFEAQAESDRQEIREAIGKLITVNEDTRRYTQEIAALAMKTERRVSDLENRQ